MKNLRHGNIFLVAVAVTGIALLLGFDSIKFYASKALFSRIINRYDSQDSGYVVQGKENWLFYREEIRYLLLQWSRQQNDVTVQKVSKLLQNQGIDLIVVPVPTPLEIYPEKLLGFSVPVACRQRADFVRKLRCDGITCIDVLPIFLKHKKNTEICLKTDTHLASAGNALLAQAIADTIRARNPLMVNSENRYHLKDTVLEKYRGDLASKYNGRTDEFLLNVNIQKVIDSTGTPYQDSLSSEILVFGDSFVSTHRGYSANLTAHIARIIGKPVAQVSLLTFNEAPRQIKRIIASRKKITLLVWVFTARELMVKINPVP